MTHYYEFRVREDFSDINIGQRPYETSAFYLKSEELLEFCGEYPGRTKGEVTLSEITQQRFEEMVQMAERVKSK